MSELADRLAHRLMEDHAPGRAFRAFARESGVADLVSAYAVQKAYVARLLAKEGTSRAGYKIGLTSPRMQAMCGIDRPVAGVVLADRVHFGPATVHLSHFGHLGIE